MSTSSADTCRLLTQWKWNLKKWVTNQKRRPFDIRSKVVPVEMCWLSWSELLLLGRHALRFQLCRKFSSFTSTQQLFLQTIQPLSHKNCRWPWKSSCNQTKTHRFFWYCTFTATRIASNLQQTLTKLLGRTHFLQSCQEVADRYRPV